MIKWKAVFEKYPKYPKSISANLCKSVHDIIKYSTSICPFESEKCGKEGKKLQNLNILRAKIAF